MAGWSSFCSSRSRCPGVHGARLSGAAAVVEPLRASARPCQSSDGDAHGAGHSRRSHQCRLDRRQARRALRHAGGRLVSGRSGDGAIFDRDCRQRAARPALRTARRSVHCSISAGLKISPSRNRSATAPTAAIMCGSGRCWIRVRKSARSGLGPPPSIAASGVSHYTGAITHHICRRRRRRSQPARLRSRGRRKWSRPNTR